MLFYSRRLQPCLRRGGGVQGGGNAWFGVGEGGRGEKEELGRERSALRQVRRFLRRVSSFGCWSAGWRGG